MKRALIEFYYQFHTKQHYFLCHDILEEAWKAQPAYSKSDAVVSLILFTTGCYHYRRANYKGAHTLFNRAYKSAIHNQQALFKLGLKSDAYINLVSQSAQKAESKQPFSPAELPVQNEFEREIKAVYADYYVMKDINTLPFICDHHLLRDRHEVETARLDALKEKRLNHKK